VDRMSVIIRTVAADTPCMIRGGTPQIPRDRILLCCAISSAGRAARSRVRIYIYIYDINLLLHIYIYYNIIMCICVRKQVYREYNITTNEIRRTRQHRKRFSFGDKPTEKISVNNMTVLFGTENARNRNWTQS